jgi:hypothetical protein
MESDRWEIVAEIFGELEAEIIRGLLEAGGIEVYLNQEGAGRAYGINVGTMGKVQVLVPSHQSVSARQILDDYLSGKYEATDLGESEGDWESEP